LEIKASFMFSLHKRTSLLSDAELAAHRQNSAANSSQGVGEVQRELVRVAFLDTLRATGVPSQWLDCDVIYIQNPQKGERVQVQFTIKKWSGLLLAHTVAFQREVIRCLDRYEPHVDHSRHEWIWKFDEQCETPFPDMPAPVEWSQKFQAAKTREAANAKAIKTADAAKLAAPAVHPKKPAPTGRSAQAPTAQRETDFALHDIFSGLTAESLTTK
jgi:hypothetical protein